MQCSLLKGIRQARECVYIKRQLPPRNWMKDPTPRTADPIPTLSERECEDFVNWLLGDIAYRVATKRGERVLRGKHIELQGDRHLRGSDQTERIFIAAKVLLACGKSQKEACVFIADNPNVRLGTSRRGRPSKRHDPRDLTSKAQTVRSILNTFRLSGPPAKISDLVHRFLWLRQNGIVEGSKVVPNSGQRLEEAARRAAMTRALNLEQLRRSRPQ